jgi:hypothetical protein
VTRKLLIFGNGIGMALDSHHFSLPRALKSVWDADGILTPEQKELICRCIGHDGAPNGEDELDDLHLAVTSCETLKNIGNGEVHWLSEDGKSFPEMTARYIHKVATDLHNYKGELPTEFVNQLVGFVKDTTSHVATLNYDKLLYISFIENDICNGYDGYLVDGMTVNKGFAEENLERRVGRDFGYYLHLHGSPLFIEREEKITKLKRDELTMECDVVGRHIVLTHVKHKPEVIAASNVLSAYWNFLRFAISEVEEVVLFGYSGQDKHLNQLIRPYVKHIPVKVVEWAGAGDFKDRQDYWKDEFGANTQVFHLDNILDFRDW